MKPALYARSCLTVSDGVLFPESATASSATAFGAHRAIYPGDPDEVHASHLVTEAGCRADGVLVDPSTGAAMRVRDLVALVRVGHTTNKDSVVVVGSEGAPLPAFSLRFNHTFGRTTRETEG